MQYCLKSRQNCRVSVKEFIFSIVVGFYLASLLKIATNVSQVFYKEIPWTLKTNFLRTTSS